MEIMKGGNKVASIHQGDCLELMKNIEDKSVDMILCDLPYGTTECSWDSVIPFEPLWEQYKRLIKHNGAIVLFASQPFTTALISSNLEMFKYEWIWNKVSKSDIFNAKNKPLKQHENICVFSYGTTANGSSKRMNYYPNGVVVSSRKETRNVKNMAFAGSRKSRSEFYTPQGENYPSTLLTFSNADRSNRFHPTQKPVALCEYLIKTYTNECEVVLDNTMGSGTTGVAAMNINRKFIGIERDDNYFEIASNRIKEAADNYKPITNEESEKFF